MQQVPLAGGWPAVVRWFQPPVFEGDGDRTRKAAILNTAVMVLIVLLPVVTVGNLLGGRVGVAIHVENALVFALFLGLRALMRRGQVGLASFALVTLSWGAVTTALLTLGTVRAPTVSFYLLVIIAAGLLLGPRGMAATIAACAAAVLGVVLSARAGLLPVPDTSVSVTQVVSLWAAFAWSGVLLYPAILGLRRALAAVESELAGRVAAETALASYLSELEGIVQRRTSELTEANARLRAEVDERTRAQEAEREARTRFELAFRIQPEALVVTRLSDGVVMEVNDGFCAMAVRAREDVLGHSAVGLWADPAERARVIEQLRQHGSVDGLECRFVRSTGETFTGLFSAGLMKRGDVDWCLSAIHDISARKALEVSREELIAQLQASLADVKTLSGIVPICMYCKNVRDDQGFWNRVEAFVQSRTAAQFSHSLCPDCERLHFPAK